jgi:voltage-gated potassium channel
VDPRSQRIADRFELPLLVAAILVLPAVIIDSSSLGSPWSTIAFVLNWAIWAAFAIELVVMLAVVPSRLEWIRANPLTVLIVVLTPPILPASLQSARALRALRLLRLLRMAPLVRKALSLKGLQTAAFLALMTVLAGGAAFSAVEKHLSTWDGVWWAVTTMTTVGYGDIYPHTNLGRVIGIGEMIVGASFFTLLVGAVAQRFIGQEVRSDVAEAEREVVAEVGAAELELHQELRTIREFMGKLDARVEELARRIR